MGREAGIDRADINTCPYGALDPCRRLWLRAYLNALSRPRTEETETP